MATSKWNIDALRRCHNVEELLEVAKEVGMPKIIDDYSRDWGTPEESLAIWKGSMKEEKTFLLNATLTHEYMVQRIAEYIDSQ